MSFYRRLLSSGGLTQGQWLPYQPWAYGGYTVAKNNYTIVQGDLVDSFPTPTVLSFDLPYTPEASQTTPVLIAKIGIYDSVGALVKNVAIRYTYESTYSFGSSACSVNIELGYFNSSNVFVSMGGRGIGMHSIAGDMTWAFKLRCHLVMYHDESSGGFDVFGAVASIEAYLKDEESICYAGVMDAREYLQGDYRESDEEFSPEFGDGSEPEGYDSTGGFDDSSDTISIPSKPQSVLSLGFVKVYKCDAGSLAQFGAELFPEIQFPTSLSDVGEVLAAVSDSIWNSKLIDYVISVHCVPGDVAAGNATDIKVGARTMTGIMGKPITDEYVDFDFGSITLDKYYKNYADYMTEIQLYLPFYGFVSLRPEEVIDGEIQVIYRFNVIDGSFTAYVLSTSSRSKLKDSLIGQYGGSCIVHLPVSNLSYASMFSSLIGAGAGAAMGIASGGAGAAVAASLAASNGVINAAQGGDVKKNNSYNASSSFMARRQPYLIVTRPVSSFSTRYNVENGLPSNVAMTIGECVGFTQAENVILDSIPCTEAEKARIRSLLASGVIVKQTLS